MDLKYEPLDPSSRQIRLLTLLPTSNTSEDAVSATLRIASLEEEPAFEALSYVWGDERDKRDITVNGCTTKVTKNLEAALRRLRGSTPRVLWVDALCINQKDIAEKNHQVPFMTQLYTKCHRVVIWLGEGSTNIESLFQFINSTDLSENASKEPASKTTMSKRQGNAARFGLIEIFELPYWQRMWTYQEMILSVNDPICVYGNYCGPLSTIVAPRTGLRLLDEGDPHLEDFDSEQEKSAGRFLTYPEHYAREEKSDAIALIATKSRAIPTKTTSLMLNLQFSVGRASKDPRDRIYALYGLYPDLQRMYPADYDDHNPLHRVLMETTVYLAIHDSAFMMLLQHFRMRPNRFSETTLPSWIPDYDLAVTRYPDEWRCAKGLQRRSSQYHTPATRTRKIARMIGFLGIHARSRQEPISTAVPGDLSLHVDILTGMRPEEQIHAPETFYTSRIEAILLPGVKYDLRKTREAISRKAIRSGFVIYEESGDKPTLRLTGRQVGTCVNLHTFIDSNYENACVLEYVIKAMSSQADKSKFYRMILAIVRFCELKSQGSSTFEDIRTTREVEWSPGDKCLFEILHELIQLPFVELHTKTLFTVTGESELYGIGAEASQDGDIVIAPIDKGEAGVPLILRKMKSNVSSAPKKQSKKQRAYWNGEGTVYYKLVGPAVIPALSEESDLVSRLAQRRVEEFFIK